MDFLDHILQSLRIEGAIVLNESYASPWAIRIPSGQELRDLVGAPEGAHVIPFHFLRSGEFSVEWAEHSQPIKSGEVAICAGNVDHVMVSGSKHHCIDLGTLIQGEEEFNGIGPEAELICGVFVLKESPFTSFTDQLPKVFTLPAGSESADPIVRSAAEMLIAATTAPASTKTYVAARALEVFFSGMVRERVKQSETAEPGFLNAMSDPKISTALNLIANDPGAPWTREELASKLALSPSRFAARFRERVGMSYQEFLTEQRMFRASQSLLETSKTIDQIADDIGYGSPTTFTRAFSKHFAISPAQWRKKRGQTVDANQA